MLHQKECVKDMIATGNSVLMDTSGGMYAVFINLGLKRMPYVRIAREHVRWRCVIFFYLVISLFSSFASFCTSFWLEVTFLPIVFERHVSFSFTTTLSFLRASLCHSYVRHCLILSPVIVSFYLASFSFISIKVELGSL